MRCKPFTLSGRRCILTRHSKRVEEKIKDVQDKSDVLRTEVSSRLKLMCWDLF